LGAGRGGKGGRVWASAKKQIAPSFKMKAARLAKRAARGSSRARVLREGHVDPRHEPPSHRAWFVLGRDSDQPSASESAERRSQPCGGAHGGPGHSTGEGSYRVTLFCVDAPGHTTSS